MKRYVLITMLLLGAAGWCRGELPPQALITNLTRVIHAHCPEATIVLTNGLFEAKYGTMLFTLHDRTMTGEVLSGKHEEEGPNFKGFLLSIDVQQGPYEGQAAVPQELHGPYFPTFIHAVETEDGKHHYWITFSYGSRCDPNLKQAIFEALPGQSIKPSAELPRVEDKAKAQR